jgi:hypothetical protein
MASRNTLGLIWSAMVGELGSATRSETDLEAVYAKEKSSRMTVCGLAYLGLVSSSLKFLTLSKFAIFLLLLFNAVSNCQGFRIAYVMNLSLDHTSTQLLTRVGQT